MNIFFLDHNPKKAAEYHCDKHVVKMCLEYAQILSTCYHICSKDKSEGKQLLSSLYKPTHVNHPCVKWACESYLHYTWLCCLWAHTLFEYSNRYGGKDHKSSMLLKYLCFAPAKLDLEKSRNLPVGQYLDINVEHRLGYVYFNKNKETLLSKIVLAMPEQYKNPKDPVKSYRQYYIGEKNKFASWDKLHNTPDWWRTS